MIRKKPFIISPLESIEIVIRKKSQSWIKFCLWRFWNPFTKALTKVSEKDVEKYSKRRKGALLKFLHAKNIGIIVSLKPGQKNLALAKQLKEQTNKNAYIFLTDTLNVEDLENFSFVDCWVNTSCPRLVDDFVMINIDELIEAEVFKPKKVVEKPIWKDKRGLEL